MHLLALSFLFVFFCISPRAVIFPSGLRSWAETMPKSACVCLYMSGSARFIAYGGMKSLQSQKAHGTPLYPDGDSSSPFYPQLFHHVPCIYWYYGCVHARSLSTCSPSLCSHSDLCPNQLAICPSITSSLRAAERNWYFETLTSRPERSQNGTMAGQKFECRHKCT